MTVPVVRCALSDLLLADLSVSIVFCYGQRLDERALTTGFERAASALPVFAGHCRERDGGLEIVCDGSGAEIEFVDVPMTMAEALGRLALPDSGLVDHVDAAAARAGRGPVTKVRVNRLADGGTVLGCSWQHAVGDMASFAAFARLWSAHSAADAGAGSAAPADPPPLIEDRAAYLDRTLPEKDGGRPGFRVVDEEESAALRRVAESAALANRTVQIYFGPAELSRLRDRLAAQSGTRLSTNDALTAHVVRTVRELDGDTAERSLIVPVNLRRMLGAAPETIGNLLGEVHLRCPADASSEQIAALLRAAVEDFADAQLSLRTSQNVLRELGPGGEGRCVPLGFDPAERTFTASSWRGLNVYDVRFDGASPLLVSPAISLPLPWVCWLVEGFDGIGLLCTLAVPASLAARLRSPAGKALLHPDRASADVLPALAAGIRRLL